MQIAVIAARAAPTTQLLRSGRLAGVEWRDLVALTPLEAARELTLCLPWLALSLALAAQHLYFPALASSFMMFLTGLRQVHNGHHHALGLGRRANEWFLFAMSVVMLGAMHAVKFNHLRHHKLCMGEGDVEAASARMSGWRAIAFGPLFPLLLHRTALAKGNRRVRLWSCAEIAANVAWIAAVFLWLRSDALRYHVIAMGVGQPDRLLRRLDRAPRHRGRPLPRAHAARLGQECRLLPHAPACRAPPVPAGADLPPAGAGPAAGPGHARARREADVVVHSRRSAPRKPFMHAS